MLGEEAMRRLAAARVAVIGIGGVGGYAVEALARSGVGHLTLVDHDTVSKSNLNRQIVALHSTVGRPKIEVAAERVLEINPRAEVTLKSMLLLPENADELDLSHCDYIVDAIDTVSAKVELARRAEAAGVPVISALGTGNKLDITALRVTDIYKTEGCPLARAVRTQCRRAGVKRLRVIFSPEPPCGTVLGEEHGRHAPGSMIFVPAAAGLMLAREVVLDLIKA